jgi:hypothetical protein
MDGRWGQVYTMAMSRRTDAMLLAGTALALAGLVALTSLSSLWMRLIR